MTSSKGGTEGLGGEDLFSNWLSSPVFEPARSRLTAIATATAIGGGLALELLAVGVSLLVAATAAFLALYRDKPFGDFSDYLLVFTLGAGAEVVLSGLIGILDRRGRSVTAEEESADSALTVALGTGGSRPT